MIQMLQVINQLDQDIRRHKKILIHGFKELVPISKKYGFLKPDAGNAKQQKSTLDVSFLRNNSATFVATTILNQHQQQYSEQSNEILIKILYNINMNDCRGMKVITMTDDRDQDILQSLPSAYQQKQILDTTFKFIESLDSSGFFWDSKYWFKDHTSYLNQNFYKNHITQKVFIFLYICPLYLCARIYIYIYSII